MGHDDFLPFSLKWGYFKGVSQARDVNQNKENSTKLRVDFRGWFRKWFSGLRFSKESSQPVAGELFVATYA
jgi:hypothetical protein